MVTFLGTLLTDLDIGLDIGLLIGTGFAILTIVYRAQRSVKQSCMHVCMIKSYIPKAPSPSYNKCPVELVLQRYCPI